MASVAHIDTQCCMSNKWMEMSRVHKDDTAEDVKMVVKVIKSRKVFGSAVCL